MADQRAPLSDTQAKVLAYMVKFLELNDQLPPMAKIAEDFGWASPNAADTHVKAMEKKGYLTRNELNNLMLADRIPPAVVYIDPNKVTEGDLAALQRYADQAQKAVLVVARPTRFPKGVAHG